MVKQSIKIGWVLLLCSFQAVAVGKKKEGWSGSYSLGAIVTAGNSDTQALNGGIKQYFVDEQWSHELEASMLRNENPEKVTAERYLANYKVAYRYRPRMEIFVDFRGIKNRFSGFDFQLYETVGYRLTLLDGTDNSFKVEAGYGFSQQRKEGEDKEHATVLRLDYEYVHRFENKNQFSSDLLALVSEDNTHFHSVTKVKARLLWNIAIEFSIKLNHNTIVPNNKTKTDTTSSIGLVYDYK
jgi:putative salt-induced outer membrane protein